jgi:hypothetical protein
MVAGSIPAGCASSNSPQILTNKGTHDDLARKAFCEPIRLETRKNVFNPVSICQVVFRTRVRDAENFIIRGPLGESDLLFPTPEVRDWTRSESAPPTTRASVVSAWA